MLADMGVGIKALLTSFDAGGRTSKGKTVASRPMPHLRTRPKPSDSALASRLHAHITATNMAQMAVHATKTLKTPQTHTTAVGSGDAAGGMGCSADREHGSVNNQHTRESTTIACRRS